MRRIVVARMIGLLLSGLYLALGLAQPTGHCTKPAQATTTRRPWG
jgi:hypothetical protein